MPVAYAVWNNQQISRRQVQIFGERAVAPANAESGSIRTMARVVRAAKIALAASHVDLAHDAASDLRFVRGFLDDADKLVPERAAKIGVTARDLDVSAANSGHRHPNQRLTVAARNRRIDQFQFAV